MAESKIQKARFNSIEMQMLAHLMAAHKVTVSDVLRGSVRALYMADPEVQHNALSEPARLSIPIVGKVRDGRVELGAASDISSELARPQ